MGDGEGEEEEEEGEGGGGENLPYSESIGHLPLRGRCPKGPAYTLPKCPVMSYFSYFVQFCPVMSCNLTLCLILSFISST